MPTPNLGLEFPANDRLPHAFNSRTVVPLDSLPALVIKDVFAQTPPGSPSLGDVYHVVSGDPGTAWEGQSGVLATWGGVWVFTPLRIGTRAYIESRQQIQRYAAPTFGSATWIGVAARYHKRVEFQLGGTPYNPSDRGINVNPLFALGNPAVTIESARIWTRGNPGSSIEFALLSPNPINGRATFVDQGLGSVSVVENRTIGVEDTTGIDLSIFNATPGVNRWLVFERFSDYINGQIQRVVLDFVISGQV